MKPRQDYIGILSVLGYVYCLPVVGQVEDYTEQEQTEG